MSRVYNSFCSGQTRLPLPLLGGIQQPRFGCNCDDGNLGMGSRGFGQGQWATAAAEARGSDGRYGGGWECEVGGRRGDARPVKKGDWRDKTLSLGDLRTVDAAVGGRRLDRESHLAGS